MPDAEAEGLMEEETIIRRFREGSLDAFEWLVRKYRTPAVRFAYHLTGDYHTAEDLAQDCFAYLLVYPEKYDYRAAFQTYLFTILRNKSIDVMRRNARQRRMLETGGGDSPWYPGRQGKNAADGRPELSGAIHNGTADDPAQLAVIREEDLEWRRRLLLLKPEYCQAVYLVDVGQMSYAQAAAVMGRNNVSFKVLLHRARKKLRQIYEKEEWDCNVNRTGANIY
ncbi:RNA polymerase sigma factor [Paenibacillus sp. MMS20-IR301]|uniref:RNA polymerase sigma factor n=1 Tax=Paenibacillus sp. MMS20-IR301 TaxID=2895946 RepID=UPI0028EBA1EF|nr:RNA polymerase sigma factor [Paenibacillus sp. MMS20-IR301]WNS46222.1 RNA polymerase sigma factor [Paenibacillus sp. MMS20-IR301]